MRPTPHKRPAPIGFFRDEEVATKDTDQPWKKLERDRVLDLYFSGGEGAHPKTIARRIGRTPKAVKRLLEQFAYNENERVTRYQPKRRHSRKGKKLTQNEVFLVKANADKGVPVADTARLLQRDISEFYRDYKSKDIHERMKQLGTGVDLCLAYRYCYYVKGISIVSDYYYDQLEAEEAEFGAGGVILRETFGGDGEQDYPPHIRALAMYLIFKYARVVRSST